LEAFKPKHLKLWKEQINYEGHNFDEFYVAIWRFFRCTPLERSNFKYVKQHLQDCGDTTGVIFPSFTDEVYMCRYYVMIHKDNARALRMADMFADRVKRKGSLDPEGEKQLDVSHSQRQWKMSTIESRVQLCQEADVSIFAARRNTIPDALIESLSEVSA
jgi:hypothetical protein